MSNPTLIVLTDRNALDDQLFGQFQRYIDLLRQTPVQADSVDHLRELLQVSSGGVIFATAQKFTEKQGQLPELSDRSNVVIIHGSSTPLARPRLRLQRGRNGPNAYVPL